MMLNVANSSDHALGRKMKGRKAHCCLWDSSERWKAKISGRPIRKGNICREMEEKAA
jgi:hypothetical protein